ncbi:MAG: YCF48-related protein [Bacteroidota bacterium]
MRKIFAFLILLSFQVIQLSAQNWIEQLSGTDSTLYDVCIVNHDTAYASGAHGIILKTTNGGASWLSQNSGVIDGLACITFPSKNIGYASGGFAGGAKANCRLVKTIDGGVNWNNVNVATGKCGGGIYFLNADTGFYAYANSLYGNSVIAMTKDGGSSWDTVYSGIGWISYFHFVDDSFGYATVNNGTVLKTTNGGQSWSTSIIPANVWMSGVYFLNKDIGLAGGGPPSAAVSMFKTIDGGANWTPIASSNMIFKICFSDNTNGYALTVDVTGAGDIIKTTNVGDSWVPEYTPKSNLRGMSFLNTNYGYAVGDSGVILKYNISSDIEPAVIQNNIFALYPNPTSDIVNLKIDKINIAVLKLNIYTVFGTCLKSEAFTKNQIDVSDLSNGTYIIELLSDKYIAKQKLIIQR